MPTTCWNYWSPDMRNASLSRKGWTKCPSTPQRRSSGTKISYLWSTSLEKVIYETNVLKGYHWYNILVYVIVTSIAKKEYSTHKISHDFWQIETKKEFHLAHIFINEHLLKIFLIDSKYTYFIRIWTK